jgi:hypothetical protein
VLPFIKEPAMLAIWSSEFSNRLPEVYKLLMDDFSAAITKPVVNMANGSKNYEEGLQ